MSQVSVDYVDTCAGISEEQLRTKVLGMFRQIIEVPTADSDSNFFALGGQSLQASRLLTQVGAVYKTILPLRSFFENPTVDGIVAILMQGKLSIDSPDLSKALSSPDSSEQGRFAPFPLNEVQHAYWIGRSSFFEMGNIATHVYVEFDNPALDLRRFEHAWNKLVSQHDMLRAVITPDGSQRILEEFPRYQIAVNDFSSHGDDDAAAELRTIRERMSHQILDTNHPLFELVVSKTNGGYRIHCSMDLIIADLWSTQIMFKELKELYENPEAKLPTLKFTFRDYVLADATLQNTTVYKKSAEFWATRLPSLPRGPDLPTAKKPALIKKPYFTRRSAKLSVEQWAELKQIASQHSLTPSGLLASAYAEVLARWSGSDRFTINLTLFNRLPIHKDVFNVVGDFTTLSLLEVDNQTQPHPRFIDRAKALQSRLWEDLDHRYYSGVKVLRDYMKLHGSAEGAFPVVFTSALVHGDTVSTDFLGEQVYGISQTPQIWLDHQVFEEEGSLVFNWDAVEELFPAGMLDDMFDAYTNLLHDLAREPKRIELEEVLTIPAWQRELLTSVNNTKTTFDLKTVYHLFEEQVARTPDNIAVKSGDTALTYIQLYQRMKSTSAVLTAHGVGKGSLVPIVMNKGWEQVVAALAIHYVGGAYVPIDPSLPLERRNYLLRQTDAKVMLIQQHMAEAIVASEGTVRIMVGQEAPAMDDVNANASAACALSDLAYVIYTSGSTGQPKGVMIDHKGVANTILDVNRKIGLCANDAVLGVSSLSFDLSVYDLFGVLAVGAKLVIPDPADMREPKRWLELMARENVTVWNSVPALMAMLIEYKEGAGALEDLPLRVAMLSGDWIPTNLPERIVRNSPDCNVISLGGATEVSIWSIYFPVADVDPKQASIPYGFPLANQSFRVLNNRNQDCPVWTSGEIYIAGDGVAKGYFGDETKTQASFVRIGEETATLYKTGDMGRYLPNGAIEFLGRKDNQVKIGGHRIELGEIEATLMRYPGVKGAVVKVCADDRGTKKLCGYVLADRGDKQLYRQIEADPEWLGHLSDRLGRVGERAAREARQPMDLAHWQDLYCSLDALIAKQYAKTFHDLGAFTEAGEKYSFDQLVNKTCVINRYEKWLRRALAVLVEEGLLARNADQYSNPEAFNGDSLAADWTLLIQDAAGKKLSIGGLEFAARSAEHLAGALTGKEEAVGFLFGDGESGGAIKMYEGEFECCNEILRELIAELVNVWPKQKELRILEIGAGIGSSTRHVLPALEGIQIQYSYTDISKFFLSFGREAFADSSFVTYRLLDIEKDPTLQGFDLHSYDVILAASVLHATKDIDETIRNVQALLAPGGALFLIEETKFPRVFNLTMGLQQGFDRFNDFNFREMHPLVSYEGWVEKLAGCGFSSVRRYVDGRSAAAMLGLEVISAHGPTQVEMLKEQDLLAHLSVHLPDYMALEKIIEIGSLPLSSNGKLQRDKLPSPWSDRQERRRIVLPHTPLEKKVCAIFEAVLGMAPIGVDDNFFELGGDSLLATKTVARIRSEFGVELAIRSLFETPMVSALVRKIEASSELARATKVYWDA
jgi:pyochelin synthetase